MTRNFGQLLASRWDRGCVICVGLDVDVRRLPDSVPGSSTAERVIEFLSSIAQATRHVVAAFKPNIAHFEAIGMDGPRVLHELVQHLHSIAPEVPVILDAKRADIASTNDGYVESLFGHLGADATTVHPYLGHEALRPFLERADKGIFVLCRTSNPGAPELQDLDVGGEPLFLRLAGLVERDWNYNRNCGLVVGATYPNELARIRQRVPHLPLLIPGVGAQGGDVEGTVRAGLDARRRGLIINSSRAILYASDGADFAEAALREAEKLDSAVREVTDRLPPSPAP